MAIFPAALPPDLEFLHLSPFSKGDAALFAAGGRGEVAAERVKFSDSPLRPFSDGASACVGTARTLRV